MAIDHISTAKAILWEQTKGNLRGMVMASGSGRPEDRDQCGRDYTKISPVVEAFIKDFEDRGFHE